MKRKGWTNMNKTKRKIFETSMKLFAEKGYDATSIEEITATVGAVSYTHLDVYKRQMLLL